MEVAVTSVWKATLQHLVNEVQSQKLWDIDEAEIIFEEECKNNEELELQLEDLIFAPAQMEDRQPETQDPLEEVNLGTMECLKPTYISGLLGEEMKKDMVELLTEFKDCFAWEYEDMPGLERKLVERRLLIKDGFKPFQ